MYDSQMICFSHCVAVGKQIRRQSGGEDVELRIMHPTMSSSQTVVGTVFSGMFTKLMKAYKQILVPCVLQILLDSTLLGADSYSLIQCVC